MLDYFQIHDVQTKQTISLNQQTISQSPIMQSNNLDEQDYIQQYYDHSASLVRFRVGHTKYALVFAVCYSVVLLHHCGGVRCIHENLPGIVSLVRANRLIVLAPIRLPLTYFFNTILRWELENVNEGVPKWINTDSTKTHQITTNANHVQFSLSIIQSR